MLDYPIDFVITLCSSYKSHSLKSNAAFAFKAASAAACKVLQDASPMPISKSEPNYPQIRYAKTEQENDTYVRVSVGKDLPVEPWKTGSSDLTRPSLDVVVTSCSGESSAGGAVVILCIEIACAPCLRRYERTLQKVDMYDETNHSSLMSFLPAA